MLEDGFRARLLNLDDGTVPVEETEFEFSEISDDDFELIRPGSRFSIGCSVERPRVRDSAASSR